MTELDKLEEYLKTHNMFYTRTDEPGFESHGKLVNQFHQITITNPGYCWDVICHNGSYGYEQGLLEYADNIEADVIGNLTAEDVINLINTVEYRRGFNDAIKQITSEIENIQNQRKI